MISGSYSRYINICFLCLYASGFFLRHEKGDYFTFHFALGAFNLIYQVQGETHALHLLSIFAKKKKKREKRKKVHYLENKKGGNCSYKMIYIVV